MITSEYFNYYLKDFPEELRNFQGYINLKLGIIFDENYPVISVKFLSETAVVIVYKKTI
jgi:hypothetical protein